MVYKKALAIILLVIIVISPVFQQAFTNDSITTYYTRSKSIINTRVKLDYIYARELGISSPIITDLYQETEIVQNVTVIDNTNVTIRKTQVCRGGWIKKYSETLTKTETISPNTSECNTTVIEDNYNSIQDYLNNAPVSINMFSGFVNSMGVAVLKNMSTRTRLEYRGVTGYHSLPVHVFYIEIAVNGTTERGEDFKGYLSATLYLSINMLLNVYSDQNYTTEISTIELSQKTTTHISMDTFEHNLLRKAKYDHLATSSIEVIIGGGQDADIRVEGIKGEDRLTARNNGSETGYVMVGYKSSGENNSIGGGYFIYAIKPMEKITISLMKPLDSNITLGTRLVEFVEKQSFDTLGTLLYGVVVLVIVAVPTIYILRHRKVSTSREDERRKKK